MISPFFLKLERTELLSYKMQLQALTALMVLWAVKLDIRPDLKICWFAVTRVCFFEYTWPVGKFFFFIILENVALIIIYNIFMTKKIFLMNEHQQIFWPARFL